MDIWTKLAMKQYEKKMDHFETVTTQEINYVRKNPKGTPEHITEEWLWNNIYT